MAGYDYAASQEERAARQLSADTAMSYHNVMTGNGYLRDGKPWCPTCDTACPCKCCSTVVAAALADQRSAQPGNIEYRSSG